MSDAMLADLMVVLMVDKTVDVRAASSVVTTVV